MSVHENIFVRSDESVQELAGWLGGLLGLEPIPGGDDSPEEVGLRGRAATVDGGWLGFVVRRNGYVEVDPAPDEVQALDGYQLDVHFWYGGKDEEVLIREGRILFEKLVAARPDSPMLLVHDIDLAVAAHLPGKGTEYFDAGVTVDAPDLEIWRDWVPGRDAAAG